MPHPDRRGRLAKLEGRRRYARRALVLAVLALPVTATRAYQELTPTEARARIAAGGDLVVLDVREYGEFCSAAQHLPNAACLPWIAGVLRDDYTKLPAGWDVLVYCASGGRSPGACLYLESQGLFGEVSNLTPGIGGWTSEREDCEPAPLLFVFKDGSEVWLDWIPTPGVQYYDVIQGRLDELTVAASAVDLGPTQQCLARESPFTHGVDDTPPGSGAASFYLVRQAAGEYGRSSGGHARLAASCD